jgi:flagellar basal-body rod protein FlgC
MDYTQAFAISAAGMNLERRRLEVASLNLANANTVVGADGGNYAPMRVVARAKAVALTASTSQAAGRFENLLAQGLQHSSGASLVDSLPIISLERVDSSPRMVYEPGHPSADAKGFVSYAGVDPATEMVTLMSAMRAYDANVAAMGMARALALRALDIGGNT